MALETGSYISALVSTNPVGATDPKSQGDDHLRFIKAKLLETFPNVTGAVTPTHTELNLVAGATQGLATTSVSLVAANTAIAARLPLAGGTMTGDLTLSSGVEAGFRIVPQNSKSAAYTTVLADSGKHIYHPAADTTARIWTIDSNATVAYPIGTAITFDNDFGAGALTIAITTDTLVLVGAAGSTGSRTLASGGQATALKVTATRWRISGVGLT